VHFFFLVASRVEREAMNRDQRTCVCLSPDEHLRLAAAASASGMPLSAWLRYQALRAAGIAPAPPAPLPAVPPRGPAGKRSHHAGIWFTKDEFESLREHARACGQTRAGYMRQVILEVDPGARRPSVRSAIVAVNRASLLLRRLLGLAERGIVVAPDLERAVAEILVEVRSLRAALLRADAVSSSEPAA
jgi:hypothetical protein